MHNYKNTTVLHINKYLILTFIATILCMITIFILSAQPATESDSNSKFIVSKIVDSATKLGGDEIPQSQREVIIDKVNNIARELMHSVVYFILGVFAQITILGLFKKRLLSSIITFTFCEVYGLTDEFHQLFVPGRTFQLLDLGMDAAGAIAAILLVLFVNKLIQKKRA